MESDAIRFDRSALISELEASGAVVKGKSIRCPFHEDQTPSGEIRQGDDGGWRFYCHAASCGFRGDIFDVIAKRTGRDVADVLRERREQTGPRRPKAKPKAKKPPRVYASVDELQAAIPEQVEAVYTYTDPDSGHKDLIVFRCRTDDGKTFKQAHQNGAGYVFGAPAKPWPIYNRKRLRDAEFVIVVEGEKCVHALHDIGFVATTSPCGAGKADCADWSADSGKDVFLWPDNHPEGVQHMLDVARIHEGLRPAASVRMIDPGPLEIAAKGDVVDFLAGLAGCDVDTKRAAIRDVLADAEPMGASRELEQIINATIDGSRRAIDWPWPAVSRLTKALLPGTVCLICGDAGDGKSFLLLEAAAHWHKAGIEVALYELEEDRSYHLGRALAQAADDSNLIDDEYVRSHPDETRRALGTHRDFLDSFGRIITDAPTKQPSLDDLVKWISDHAKRGTRIIAVDPVSAAANPSDRSWEADLRFLMSVKGTVRESGSSLILVTHPRKGKRGKAPGLEDLAGGAAYSRFSQSVLWLERFKTPRQVTIAGTYGNSLCTINRALHLCKARNAFGHGMTIGFNFDGASLKFAEQGVVMKDE